ncbi:hypothetical protein M0Q28_06045 [Patescibacteria group bacterium]|jgi:hypothetical protein|nr:hypothetical protein [Patescibacteria group bacterium]
MIGIITDSIERAYDEWVRQHAETFVVASYSGRSKSGEKFRIFRCVGSLHAETLRGYEFSSLVIIGKPNKKSTEVARTLVRQSETKAHVS